MDIKQYTGKDDYYGRHTARGTQEYNTEESVNEDTVQYSYKLLLHTCCLLYYALIVTLYMLVYL